jgi:hypothetical protein
MLLGPNELWRRSRFLSGTPSEIGGRRDHGAHGGNPKGVADGTRQAARGGEGDHPAQRRAHEVAALHPVRDELQLRVTEREKCIEVAPVEGVKRLVKELDVLLRNRPRSIALWPATQPGVPRRSGWADPRRNHRTDSRRVWRRLRVGRRPCQLSGAWKWGMPGFPSPPSAPAQRGRQRGSS